VFLPSCTPESFASRRHYGVKLRHPRCGGPTSPTFSVITIRCTWVRDFNRLSGDSPTGICGQLDMFVRPELISAGRPRIGIIQVTEFAKPKWIWRRSATNIALILRVLQRLPEAYPEFSAASDQLIAVRIAAEALLLPF